MSLLFGLLIKNKIWELISSLTVVLVKIMFFVYTAWFMVYNWYPYGGYLLIRDTLLRKKFQIWSPVGSIVENEFLKMLHEKLEEEYDENLTDFMDPRKGKKSDKEKKKEEIKNEKEPIQKIKNVLAWGATTINV